MKVIRKRIRRNPARSGRSIAKEFGTDPKAIRNLTKTDLGMKVYKKQLSAGLTNRNKLERVKRCKIIKKRHGCPPIIFSDKKLFLLQRPLNKQNDRVYGVSLQEIPRNVRAIPQYQNASGVKVFGTFFMEGKIPLKFIDRGVKINQQLYLNDILKSHVKPMLLNVW